MKNKIAGVCNYCNKQHEYGISSKGRHIICIDHEKSCMYHGNWKVSGKTLDEVKKRYKKYSQITGVVQ
jgi:hypothetical protein